MILTEQLIPFGTKTERNRNIFRPMNYKFVPHNYVRKSDGKVTLLLDLSQDGKRHKEAVNDIYMVLPKPLAMVCRLGEMGSVT